jgi:nucleoside-diphosphate-sugar epimerase
MYVVVAGGHGKVGLRLLRLLAERGDRARGLIRRSEQADDLARAGAEAVQCDLEREQTLAPFVEGADAVVFSAGAGPGSGADRKRTVDMGGALKLVHGAREEGVGRYVMVSAIGAADPSAGGESMRPYLEAKAEADRALADSGLDFTIVRPGRLTDDAGSGRVAAGEVARGDVPRDDVAATLLAVLEAPNTIGKTFNVVHGETPIEEAVRAL